MTDAVPEHSTFHLFPQLPPELRFYIWQYALPEKDNPALFNYWVGCWRVQEVSESDKRYKLVDKTKNKVAEFCHGLLDPVRVKAPAVVFVNREARDIALAWARKQGIETRFCDKEKCHILERRFDPTIDTLYMRRDMLESGWFHDEPFLELHKAKLPDETLKIGPDIRRIAVARKLKPSHLELLPLVIDRFPDLESLIVIPDLTIDFETWSMCTQWRWESESTDGNAFSYSHEDGLVTTEIGESASCMRLFGFIRLAREWLYPAIDNHPDWTLEIRLGSGVKI